MFTIDRERVEEFIRLYEDLGYEVRLLKPSREEFDELCGDCALSVCDTCYVIYIRKKPGSNDVEDKM